MNHRPRRPVRVFPYLGPHHQGDLGTGGPTRSGASAVGEDAEQTRDSGERGAAPAGAGSRGEGGQVHGRTQVQGGSARRDRRSTREHRARPLRGLGVAGRPRERTAGGSRQPLRRRAGPSPGQRLSGEKARPLEPKSMAGIQKCAQRRCHTGSQGRRDPWWLRSFRTRGTLLRGTCPRLTQCTDGPEWQPDTRVLPRTEHRPARHWGPCRADDAPGII